MTTTTDWTPLAAAVRAIAGQCDGALSDDGRGFAAADVPLGHYLASVPADSWDEQAATAAWQLARTYQTQLADAGIDLADLPRPENPDRHVRDEMTDRRRAAKKAGKTAAASFCHTAQDDGKTVILLGFPYNPDLVEETRRIPGRSFRAAFAGRKKVNVYPASSAAALLAFCTGHGITADPQVAALAADAPGDEQDAPAHTAPNLVLLPGGDKLAFRFDGYPGRDVLDAVKDVDGRRWDADGRQWTVPSASAAQALHVAEAHGLTATDQARAAAARATAQADRAAGREAWNLAASVALTPAGAPAAVPGLAGDLKPHQHAGLEFIAANRRVLVGDKMGLGKTLLSLAAVAADGAWPAVIACKTSLRLNWQAELARFFPDRTVHLASGNAPQPVPPGTDVVIIGFDVLKDTYKAKGAGGGARPGWARALAALNPKALIVDESHFGKEATASRSQAMETLGAQVAARDGIVLCLSGTAIVNRPAELLQQLRILGRLHDMGGEWDFKYRYCDPQYSEWGTTFNGATNLDELHCRLRSAGIYLRRGDDALNLPKLTIRAQWLTAAEADPAAMNAYRDAEHDFLTAMIEMAQDRGVDLSDPAERDAFCRKAMSAQVLVRLNVLRQLAGRLKTPAVTAAVRRLGAAGEKTMVAAHHRPIVDHYAKTFGGLRIQGGQSTESVEADKAAFQTLPTAQAPVISVSTQAGGVGHTLTAAAHGILAELPWTWAEVAQMAARLHRIGQEREVDFAVVLASGTVDEYMWQVVSSKRSITAAVLDGDAADDASEKAAAAEVMGLMLAACGR